MSQSSSSSSDAVVSNDTVFQNSVYIGINLQNILYGIELALYFKTIHILLIRNKNVRKRSDIFYMVFSTAMLLLVTVWVVTQTFFGEEMWVMRNTYPGGANAYWNDNIGDWYMDWGTTAIVVLQLMTDGLMIYRCRVIWNSYRAIIIPALLWLASFILAALFDWTSSLPGSDYFSGLSRQIGLAYYTVSVFMNTTLTCMICYFMLRHGRKIQEGLGPEYASPYFALVTLIVESVAPYTLSGIVFLVTLGLNSPTSVVFVCIYFLMMCVSPQILILRVMMGRAWDKNTSKRLDSTLKFTGSSSRSRWFGGESTTVAEGPVYLQPLESMASQPETQENKAASISKV